MSSATTVYVPCDVVGVRVRLGYGDSLSAMEEVVLQAIHAGLTDVSQLARRLGLGKRLVHDLIHDLWRQGHITVDTAARTIAVSAEVARCLDAGEPQRLSGAEAVQETRELMIDKLTLRVLPAMGRTKPPLPKMAVPVESRVVHLEDVPQNAVLQALHQSLREDEEASAGFHHGNGTVIGPRSRRVLSYRLPPPDLRKAGGRRWTELKVVPHWDEEVERLTLTVVDGRVPAELREHASEQLTQVATDSPRSQVFIELRRLAQGSLVDPPSPSAALDRLERRIAATADIPAGQRHNWHNELNDDARQLEGLLQARIDREIVARVVTGDEQDELPAELVREARTQLVIVSPWIRYPALKRLIEPLADRIRHGVRVVFVWGIDTDQEYEEAFDEQTRNALEDLARGAPGGHVRQIVLPKTTARTHAKLLVVDDRKALVTSRNLLSSAGGLPELGVLLDAGSGGSPIITDLLGWARSAIPSFEQSRMVSTAPRSSTPVDDAGSGEQRDPGRTPGPRDVPPRTAIEPPFEHVDDGAVEAASLRLWTAAWRDQVERCRAFLEERTLPSARLVTDATHRDLMRTALTKATRRLVIASDGLSAEAVGTGMLGALRSCLDRKVEVTLVYSDRARTGQARIGWEAARTHLEALRQEYPGTLRLIGRPNHAKVLVWDDDAVVGSFNYLSFEGRYGRQRLSSELSVRLTGQETADAVAAAVGAAPVPRAEKTVFMPIPTTAAFGAAQRLLNAYAGDVPPDPGFVRDVLAEADDPWRILELIGENPDAPSGLVRVAAARCLADRTAGSGPERAGRWHRWMIDHLWREGEFVEAAVLRHAIPDPALRPRRLPALLAAARGTPEFIPVLERFAVDDLDDGERAVGVLAAGGAVILQGSQSAADALEILALDAEGIWAELASRVEGYRQKAANQPITRSLLRHALSSSQRAQDLSAAWETLEHLLGNAAASTFDNSISTRTHRALFDSNSGEFAVLTKIVQERDSERLRGWLAENPARNLPQLITNVGATVAPGRPAMHGSHRKRYLKRLEALVLQAETVRRRCATGQASPDAAPPSGALEFGQWLADGWVELTENTDGIADPEGRLAREFLNDLEELARWGSQNE